MSLFQVDVGVGNLEGGDLAPVRPVVDTGAAHSMLPASLMEHLRIRPHREVGFILADGSQVRYDYGFARFSIDGDEGPAPVIFGPEDNCLLGASTLEAFNLLVDPAGERLLPAELVPLGWGGPRRAAGL